MNAFQEVNFIFCFKISVVNLQDDYNSTVKLSLYVGESINWPPLCSTLTISLYSQNDC
jgi:hypothetical protein